MAGKTLSLANFAGAIAKGWGGGVGTGSSGVDPKPEPFMATYAIHHPHATFNVTQTGTAIGSGTSMRVNDAREERLLKNFFEINFNNVNLFNNLYL